MGWKPVSNERQGSAPVRLQLGGTIVALRGWGMVAPKWTVRVELRDPGVLAIVRAGSIRSGDAFTFNMTELALGLDATQRTRGGRYVGGGFGITGMVKGVALAKAMNSLTEQRWEETRLHLTEHLPVGTQRSITITIPGHTPTSLAELIRPALRHWATHWVEVVLEDRVRPFADTQHLPAVYAQIDGICERLLINQAQVLELCSHYTQPMLAALHTRLHARAVTHAEAQEISAEIEVLLAEGRITRHQAQPLQQLLAQIPTPAAQAERGQAHQTLIGELRKLRATGAITEHELQTELARLRQP